MEKQYKNFPFSLPEEKKEEDAKIKKPRKISKKVLIIIIIAIVVVVLCVLLLRGSILGAKKYQSSIPDDFVSLDNDFYSVQIKHPLDWEVKRNYTDQKVVNPILLRPLSVSSVSFEVFVSEDPPGMSNLSVDDRIKAVKNTYTRGACSKKEYLEPLKPLKPGETQIHCGKLIEVKKILIRDMIGFQTITEDADLQGVEYRILAVVLSSNNKSYSFIYKAAKNEFSNYLPEAEQIISSIEFQ